jgi:hypothetical protein
MAGKVTNLYSEENLRKRGYFPCAETTERSGTTTCWSSKDRTELIFVVNGKTFGPLRALDFPHFLNVLRDVSEMKGRYMPLS